MGSSNGRTYYIASAMESIFSPSVGWLIACLMMMINQFTFTPIHDSFPTCRASHPSSRPNFQPHSSFFPLSLSLQSEKPRRTHPNLRGMREITMISLSAMQPVAHRESCCSCFSMRPAFQMPNCRKCVTVIVEDSIHDW